MFDIVLKEDGSRAKLTDREIETMKRKIWDPDVTEISVDGEFTAASGVMSSYLLEHRGAELFAVEKRIKEILDDWRKESKDGVYSFNGFDVFMSR